MHEPRRISRPADAPADHATLQEVEQWLRHRRTESAYGFDPATGKRVWERHTDGMEVLLTPADRAQLRGMTFTHNHPRGWYYPEGDPRRAGSSFSPDDLYSAALSDIAELRAVTPHHIFTMRPRNGGPWPSSELVGPMYLMEEEAYRRDALQRMAQGMMTVAKDNADAGHAVWSKLAPVMGLVYRREGAG